MRRVDLVDRCCDLLRASSNVALHAPPGFGKSEVARLVRQNLSGEGTVVVNLSLATYGNGALAFEAIAAELAAASGFRHDYGGLGLHESWRAVNKLRDQSRALLVLCLENFDHVAQWDSYDAGEFLRHLRELLSAGDGGRMRGLIVSRRTIREIEVAVRGISTLADICATQYVRPVREDEVAELWPVESKDAARIWAWSGGIPTLTSYRVAIGRHDKDVEDDDEAEHHQMVAVGRILDYLQRMQLLDATVQLILGPQLEELPYEAALLRSLGVLRPRGGSEQVALQDYTVLREQLVARSRESNAWGSFGAAERALRGLVDSVLTDRHGLEWPEVLSRRFKAVGGVVSAALLLQSKEKRKYGKTPSWLAYTYPNELWCIVNAAWDDFRLVLQPGTKDEWRTRVEGLGDLRAPMAHNRGELLDETSRLRIRMYSDAILKCAGAYADHSS